MKPVVCVIGTTEPWSAAGLGLDLRALVELGAHPVFAVAAVSAQDAGGVRALYPLPIALLRAQLDALSAAPIAAFRIGALPTADHAREVSAWLAAAGVPSVYDPALAASGGGALTTGDAATTDAAASSGHSARAGDAATTGAAARAGDAATTGAAVSVAWSLVPYVDVITPNLAEAELLLARPVRDPEAMRAAARELCARGARAVLLKGGHLAAEANAAVAGAVTDVLCDAQGLREFSAPRLAGELRGTGCLLADALAVGLARGEPLFEAVTAARAYVRRKIETGFTLGGMRLAGGG
jgi:hydroxymethylpyrimidine/phosphomethylpyrimidine kinase